MYIDLLKQLYYQERKKLESMWIYQQETKLRILRLRKTITESMQENLTISQLLGRADISEEVKDNLLRDSHKEDRVSEQIKKNIDDELDNVESAEKEEMARASYNPKEYADYLVQLEKVCVLENVLSEERLFAEGVYEEQKLAIEKGGKDRENSFE